MRNILREFRCTHRHSVYDSGYVFAFDCSVNRSLYTYLHKFIDLLVAVNKIRNQTSISLASEENGNITIRKASEEKRGLKTRHETIEINSSEIGYDRFSCALFCYGRRKDATKQLGTQL